MANQLVLVSLLFFLSIASSVFCGSVQEPVDKKLPINWTYASPARQGDKFDGSSTPGTVSANVHDGLESRSDHLVPVEQYRTSTNDLGIEPYGKDAVQKFWTHSKANPADDWTGFYMPQFASFEDFGEKPRTFQPAFASDATSQVYSQVAKPEGLSSEVDSTKFGLDVPESKGSERKDSVSVVPMYKSIIEVTERPYSPLEQEGPNSAYSENIAIEPTASSSSYSFDSKDIKDIKDSKDTPITAEASMGGASRAPPTNGYDNSHRRHEPLHINNTNPVVYDQAAIDRSKTDYLEHSPLSKHDPHDDKIHSYQYIFGPGPSNDDGRLHSYETTNEYHYPNSKVNQVTAAQSPPLLEINYLGTNYERHQGQSSNYNFYDAEPKDTGRRGIDHEYEPRVPPPFEAHRKKAFTTRHHSPAPAASVRSSVRPASGHGRRVDFSSNHRSDRRPTKGPDSQKRYQYHSPTPSETHGYEYSLDVAHGAGRARICQGTNCGHRSYQDWHQAVDRPRDRHHGDDHRPLAKSHHHRPSPPRPDHRRPAVTISTYRDSPHRRPDHREPEFNHRRDHYDVSRPRPHHHRKRPDSRRDYRKRPAPGAEAHFDDYYPHDYSVNRVNRDHSDDNYDADYSYKNSLYSLPKPRTYYGPYGKYFPGHVSASENMPVVYEPFLFEDK